MYEMFIGTIETNETAREWHADLRINETRATFKLDTGAQCNVMPLSLYQQITQEKLQKSNTKLMSYSGHRMQTIGKKTLLVESKGKFYPTEFQITAKTGLTPVLGLPTCLEMSLVKRIYTVSSDDKPTTTREANDKPPDNKDQTRTSEKIMAQYADVFQGLGCLDGEYHIEVDHSVRPVVHPPRRVPFALKNKLRAELERMEKLNVITKVTEATAWVSSVVVTERKTEK